MYYSQVSSYSVLKYIYILFYFSLKLKKKKKKNIEEIKEVKKIIGVLACRGAGCTTRMVVVQMSRPRRTSLHLLHRVADLLQTEFAGSLREQP